MAGPTVVLNNIAINDLLYDPTGPIGREMGRVALVNLLPIAQAALSRPWPGPPGPFPPVGPPYLRTGELRDSLRVDPTVLGSAGPEAAIIPTAIHRGVNYGQILQSRGYRFLPDYFYV